MALTSSVWRVGLLVSLFATGLPATAQSETGEIHVRVVTAETNRAIAGVEIVATSRAGAQHPAVSNDSGSVIFDTLDAGLYEQVRQSFEKHMGDDGAHFLTPVRVDLLQK